MAKQRRDRSLQDEWLGADRSVSAEKLEKAQGIINAHAEAPISQARIDELTRVLLNAAWRFRMVGTVESSLTPKAFLDQLKTLLQSAAKAREVAWNLNMMVPPPLSIGREEVDYLVAEQGKVQDAIASFLGRDDIGAHCPAGLFECLNAICAAVIDEIAARSSEDWRASVKIMSGQQKSAHHPERLRFVRALAEIFEEITGRDVTANGNGRPGYVDPFCRFVRSAWGELANVASPRAREPSAPH
jgi:hypothetical protein